MHNTLNLLNSAFTSIVPCDICSDASKSISTQFCLTVITVFFAADDDIDLCLLDITNQTMFNDMLIILFDCPDSHRHAASVREKLIKFATSHANHVYLVSVDIDPGLYSLWNLGVSATNTQYVCNMNPDDRHHPKWAELLVSKLNSNPTCEIASCCYNAVPFSMRNSENYLQGLNSMVAIPNASVFFRSKFIYCSRLQQLEEIGFASNDARTQITETSLCDELDRLSLMATEPKNAVHVKYTYFRFCDLFRWLPNEKRWTSYNIPHCAPIWRRTLHEKFGEFDENSFGTIADWEFFVRCLSKGSIGVIVDQVLCNYAVNENSHNRRVDTTLLVDKVVDKYLKPRLQQKLEKKKPD